MSKHRLVTLSAIVMLTALGNVAIAKEQQKNGLDSSQIQQIEEICKDSYGADQGLYEKCVSEETVALEESMKKSSTKPMKK